MADDNTVPLTPSDVVGAMQRRLREIHDYLNNVPHQINPQACRAHLAPMFDQLDVLEAMQASVGQQENGAEARA